MKIPFWRTGVVDISDAELIVLDVLADYGALHFAHLSDVEFDLRFNRDHHHLGDQALHALLQRWISLGWLRQASSSDGVRCELTPLGGAQWELERLPDWSRLVCGYSGCFLHEQREISTYIGKSGKIVQAYFEARRELEGFVPLRVRCIGPFFGRARSYFWKPPGSSVAIVVREQAGPIRPLDWASYERTRRWWSNSFDLMAWRGHVP